MENTEFTIEKSTVECYKIRHSSGMYWADINVTMAETKGRISISSDYGNYANFWGACGCSFKIFLAKLDIDYAADKFGADRWFDLEGTIKSYRIHLMESRRFESISANLARVIFNEIKKLEGCGDESEFVHIMWNQHHRMSYYDNCPHLERTITPQFKRFWKEVWPVFINQLKSKTLQDQ